MCAKVLPPTLTILLCFTTIKSIDKTIKRIPVTRSEIPLVEENGETKAIADSEVVTCGGAAVGIGTGVGIGVEASVGFGAIELLGSIVAATPFALASEILPVSPLREVPKN
ncbi:MAG: hypothetical protein UT88_C0004G0031 [Candidatus Woesebacteria bacterium GW2011_GWD2_40_19]|nr:MAG: hypothetical protein UT88_C0004G0031 [Candidatus Woesebacteria bacterium GW2011_GWD2_40_19]